MSTTKVRADRETLRAARVRVGLGQEELAKATGLSPKTLSLFENGKTVPHESTLEAIQAAIERRGIVFTNGDKPGFYFDKTKADMPS